MCQYFLNGHEIYGRTRKNISLQPIKRVPLPPGEGQGEGIKKDFNLIRPPLPNPPPVGEGVCKAFFRGFHGHDFYIFFRLKDY